MNVKITPDLVQAAAIAAIEAYKLQFGITLQGTLAVEAFARQVMARSNLESELCGYQFISEKS